MSRRRTNLKRLAVGAVGASVLALGGVAYAQQDGQAPNDGQSRQERQVPGDRGDCPWKNGSGGQGRDTRTEI